MKLDHLVILLSNLSESLGFYDTLLPLIGFNKSRDHVYENEQQFFIELKQAPDEKHEYRRLAPGLNHLGFTANALDDLVAVRKSMIAAGFEVADIQEFEDGKAVFFKDKDGMRIEVGCYG